MQTAALRCLLWICLRSSKSWVKSVKLTLVSDTFMGSLASKCCLQFYKSPVFVTALWLPTFFLLKAENFRLCTTKSITHLKHHTAVGTCTTPGLGSVVGKEWSPRGRDERLEPARSLVAGSRSDPEPNLFAVSIITSGGAMSTARGKKPTGSVTGEIKGWAQWSASLRTDTPHPLVTRFLTTRSEIAESLFKN